ncbi:TPR-like protein [Daldinia sp. FL1419]|nr:TPR-like protein [Daldinia sp. FL1419]
MSESTDINRNGLTQLSTPASGSCNINIVLVHGLRGHPQTTWEDRSTRRGEDMLTIRQRIRNRFSRRKLIHNINDNDGADEGGGHEGLRGSSMQHGVFWPRDYLVKDLPKARVWTYGYNADVIGEIFRANNKNSISQHGQDLRVRIERDITGSGHSEPIIFVAHSLGGIIVKYAMWKSRISSSQTKLIIFLGTPHRGSEAAGWGHIASNLAALALQDSNKKIVQGLKVDGEVLDIIHDEFVKVAMKDNIKIHSFQETRGISGVKGFHDKVVPDFSSKVGISEAFEVVETLDADHMQMARCTRPTDQLYSSLLKIIKQFVAGGLQRYNPQSPLPSTPSIPKYGVGTPVYHIPHPRNEHFAGRRHVLKELEESFFVEKRWKLAIFGLGGVGKTQVALEFAYRIRDSKPEYSIFWVLAQSEATFQQSYAELAKLLRIPGEEDQRVLVKRYLSSMSSGKWLLIVDNVDDYEAFFHPSDSTGMAKYLPQNNHGLVLFTTRTREVAVDLTTNVIDLEKMSPEEAVCLFRAYEKKDAEQDEALIEKLAEELTYLPLAIVQATSYMNKNMMSTKRYLDLLQGREENIANLMKRGFYDDTTGMHRAVLKTWTISFEQIQRCDHIAADIFSFMACINPKAIPQSLLPIPDSEVDFENAIGTLLGYAFITRREDGSMFDMHRLVHIAIRGWIQDRDSNGMKNMMIDAITYISLIPIHGGPEIVALRGEYLPHALRLVKESEGCYMRKYILLCNVGFYLEYVRRFKEAIPLWSEAIAWRDKYGFQGDLLKFPLEYYLAHSYHGTGQYQDAVKLLERLKSNENGIFDHPKVRFQLASAYIQDKQVESAVDILKGLEATRKMSPEDSPSQEEIEHALALAYSDLGQRDKAIRMYKNVLAVRKQLFAEDDYVVLMAEYNLADAYSSNNQFGEAIEILEHVMPILKKTLAEDDHFFLLAQDRCSHAYLHVGRFKEAIDLYERVIPIRKKTWTEDNERLLALEHNLALAYVEDRRFEEGVHLFQYVVAIKGATLPKEHRDRLHSEQRLGWAYLKCGKIEDAVEMLKQVTAIYEVNFSEEDRLRLDSEFHLAWAYIEYNEVESAIGILERIIGVLSTICDEGDGLLVGSRELLTEAYRRR